ncbi:MAG: metallophosphoesterase, partial [Eubacteriales bacterium]|nr:metallophosphoesterase [Eubacteriales bacterium]
SMGNSSESSIGNPVESSAERISSLRDDPLWSDPDSMTAMIVSDLHYTENKDLDHSLVPGIALAEEITDAMIDEVIDRHPDVFIMTGDNSNSGDAEYVSRLAAKLGRIRDAGIRIILTTGNHDFDLMEPGDYEKAYFGLLDPVDRDPASLSYTSIVKEVVFLAMDDNAVYHGGQGEFSSGTMQWLEDMLEKYSGRTIIFLSHHNVLYGLGEENSASHLIQNPELPSLLQEGGVRLALSGHMHYPYILEKDGLWEILSGMPFSGRHLAGNLAIGKDRAVYYASPIDFAQYGSTIEKELEKLDQENSSYMTDVFSGILEQENLRGAEKKNVLNLANRFFQYFGNGTLKEHTKELQSDPSYSRMIDAFWKYNYGPWMKKMIETTEHSSVELQIVLD